MKNFISAASFFYICLYVVFSCYGQNPRPSETPNPADEETVKITTTLIQVDVTVTDKKGKIIADLRPEDFEIFENDEKKEITNFSFISAGSEPATTAAKNRTKIPLLGSPPIKPEQVRRTIVLIVDDLTITFERFVYVKKSLRRFVDEQMRNGDFVAIARTGGSIGIFQQFTTDRQQLHAAIEKLRWNPLGLGGPKFSMPPVGTSGDGNHIGLRNPDKEAEDFRQSAIAANLIGGINYFISGMKNLPGRKSAIIFSEGFTFIKRDVVGPERDFRVNAALEKLFDTAARASVVISTIDARGLEPESNQAFNDTQDGLIYLAEQTGGTAFLNSNDFNLGIEKTLDNQKGYYLIGYTPDTFDPKTQRFNKFTVKVKREGVTVRYRSGFFGASNDPNEKPVNRTSSEQLKSALIAPFAVNDIALNLNTLFGNEISQGSFVRSLLHINAGDLKFTDEAGGKKKAVFDVLAMSFNEDGIPVDKITKNYELILPTNEYEKLLAEGFVYHFTFPVEKPGAYQFRVAILDKQSGDIGSASQFIEIPNLKKGDLTLSGIVLESLTQEQWRKETAASRDKFDDGKIEGQSSLLTDTALKHFKRNTVLRYGFEIYNAKLDAMRKPQLTAQINVFSNGKLVLEGKPSPVDSTGQSDGQRVSSFGAIVLEGKMPPGAYILQIIMTDRLAKGKDKTAAQFVQIEVVE